MEDFPYNVFTNKQAVLVNGDPHLVVIREIDHESESEFDPNNRVKIEFVIICFDFTEEKFKEVAPLDLLEVWEDCYVWLYVDYLIMRCG